MQKSLKVHISPIWEEIEPAKGKLIGFLEGLGFTEDAMDALTMITGELMENAVKYGVFQLPSDHVGVDVLVSQGAVTIEVTNPVNEVSYSHLKNLDKAIQWIRGYQDPFEAYVDKLKEISKKPLHDEESGLGLVRIAYEGRGVLDFFVSDKGILNVSAISNMEGECRT
jgi:hypothetical protein